MSTAEKVAYLKGLAEGLALGKETKEEKLICAIIDVLGAVAEDMDSLEGAICDLGDELDSVSDDLASVEEIVYDDMDDYCYDMDDYDDDDDDECCCHHHHDDEDDEHEGCCHHHGDGEKEEEAHECCHGHGSGRGHHHGGCCHGHRGQTLYEVTCPACENVITIDESTLSKGSIQCPGCGGILEFEFHSEDEVAEE